MSPIKAAFNNLINTIEAETLRKFAELEERAKAKRLNQLQQDLEELRKNKVAAQNEAYKEFNPVKE